MKLPQLCALSAVALLVLSSAALAGDGNVDDKVRKMDTNQDGMVSAEEHAAGAKMMFERMDADRDGNVTAAEMDAGHKAMKPDKMGAGKKMSSAEKIGEIDGNADGMLSAEEHVAGAARMFSEMDADADGSLSSAEMKAGHKRMTSDGK